MKKYSISEDLINKIATYLSGRPFIEVAEMISKIQSEVKPIEETVEEI